MADAHAAGIAVALATTAIAVASPLLLSALGEVVVEKSGVINVGIEAMMLTGAFAAYGAAYASGSAVIGVLAACGAGIALAALFALFCLTFRADQVVVGSALNILALGITGVVTPVMSNYGSVPSLASYVLFRAGGQSLGVDALAVAGVVLTPLIAVFLSRTRAGLTLRAAGEYPAAAQDAGASINRIRAAAILFGGAAAGMAGACLSIAYNVGIAQGLSSGRGFIALAVVIVGRWNPFGALLAALLFGFASALQAWGQAIGLQVPYQLLLALPYLLTLAALVFRSGGATAPAFLGQPYTAE